MDWFSRYVLSWRLSNTRDAAFCIEALDEALDTATPEIFNTDQGSQFTGHDFTGRLENAAIRISMDGRGRCFDFYNHERRHQGLGRTTPYQVHTGNVPC